MTDLLRRIATHLTLAMQPVVEGVADLPTFQLLALRMGWQVESLPEPYVELGTLAQSALEALPGEDQAASAEEILAALARLRVLHDRASALTVAPVGVEAAAFLAEFGPRLFELLLMDYLRGALPRTYAVLAAVGVVTEESQPETAIRPGYLRVQLHPDRIASLFTDPFEAIAATYGWGTPALDFDGVALRLLELADAIGLYAHVAPVDPAFGELMLDRPVPMDTPFEPEPTESMVVIPIFVGQFGGEQTEVGIAVLELPGTAERLPGIVVEPRVPPVVGTEVVLGAHLRLQVRAGSNLEQVFGVWLRPGEVSLRYPFEPGSQLPAAGFGVSVQYRPDEVAVLLGERSGSRLEVAGATVAFRVDNVGGAAEVVGELTLDSLTTVVETVDLDGFLALMVGNGALRIPGSLGVQWSSRDGLTLTGAAGFIHTVALQLRIGPVMIHRLTLSLHSGRTEDGAPRLGAGVEIGLSGTLGPVGFTVDGLGLTANVLFAPGNAGPLDLATGVTVPSTLGLSLDAGPAQGGGRVQFDPALGRYGGALSVRLGKITVAATALLDTRMPGGRPGFSLLVLMSARFTGIPLGLGVTLTGVGGLIGVNRRIDIDALRERYATGTAGRLLADADPVHHLPALLTELSAVFPVAEGRYVVGPTLQLRWAKVVTLDVGVFLEFPGPARVVLLGTARATVDHPRADGPLLRLRCDFVGVLDLAHATFALDAVLIESRLLESFPVTGGLLVRAGWGAEPYAIFSIGGFHPDFAPGSLPLPKTLTRLAMSSGSPDDALYLRFEGYFAITPNTVQFGASVEVSAKLGPLRVRGFLGFDALLRFEPFYFQVSFQASMRVQWRGRNLAGIKVSGTLSGPGPVKFSGRACIELLFFDICGSASFELGSDAPPAVNPVSSALEILADELRNPANLRALSEDPSVVLRDLPAAGPPVLAPTGIVWEQTRAPLGLLLDRFEGAPLRRRETVEVTGAAVSGEERAWFAPGGFTELNDAEALSRRSFERLRSGVRLATGPDDVSEGRTHVVAVVEIRLPARPDLPRFQEPLAAPDWLTEAAQVREGRSDGPAPSPAITIGAELWEVRDADGQHVVTSGESQAHQLARALLGAVALPAGDVVAVEM